MSLAQILDLCRFLPTLGGTTDWTYSSTVTGYQSPTNAGAISGATYHMRAETADLSQWEISEGTYDSGTGVFARTTVLYNSSGTGTLQSGAGTKISFSTVPQVAIVAVKSDIRNPVIIGQRLTLTSGTPVTESDVTGATTVYLTPSGHDIIEVYTGNGWEKFEIAELSLALDSTAAHTGYHQSGKNFFCGVFLNAGVPTLATSVAWSSDTATGTGAGTCEVEMFQGRIVNKVSMTVRFGSASGNTASVAARQMTLVGGFRATADGVTEDSLAKRFVSNLNAVVRPMYAADAATNYFYDTTAFRQANADAANQCDWFHCVAGRPLSMIANATVWLVNGAGSPSISVGIDSITVGSGFKPNTGISASMLSTLMPQQAIYKGFPGIGRHYASRLEAGITNGVNNTRWFSNSGINANLMGETFN